MFLKYSIIQNRWLWVHIVAGGVLAKILLNWFPPLIAILIVVLLAMSWELLEFSISDIQEQYGSKERFWWDAFGDVLGSAVMGAIVLI
ncbi:MAG: hypothetical protein Kow0042_20610 [Calditrichia bacterium]